MYVFGLQCSIDSEHVADEAKNADRIGPVDERAVARIAGRVRVPEEQVGLHAGGNRIAAHVLVTLQPKNVQIKNNKKSDKLIFCVVKITKFEDFDNLKNT